VVPDDLNALEEMEAQSLEWAREDRLQQQRNQAILTATKIIDLKLRQAGLFDEYFFPDRILPTG
jgi:hypothetical protein